MVLHYSEYIQRFVRHRGHGAPPTPGEHHFVAAYLVPRLFAISNTVPDYINPDGTKSILGDVVYYKDGRHHIGIEVKLGTIRLTKREMNEWIVNDDESIWPTTFVGVGSKGIALSSWSAFRSSYLKAVRTKNSEWSPVTIESGYGPQKSVDEMVYHLDAALWFPYQTEASAAAESEAKFLTALRLSIEA